MKRAILGVAVLALVAVAVAFSTQNKQADLVIDKEKANPWTNLELKNDPTEFQFAIVSDRTGGHRAQVFSRAVARLNLLQPEFILCVGDLIEGGRKKPETIAAEWKEFDDYVNQLKMPFFYVPGNHDVAFAQNDKI